jgi:cytidyltransferase-like protein
MSVMILSGYFNPIHPGHISMMREAKTHADTLIVIINNDHQVKIKGTVPFMDEWSRSYIVQSIKHVDYTLLSIDKDVAVVKSIEKISRDFPNREIFFGNGGDRAPDASSIPEVKYCEENGIGLIYGLGDKKRYSSSSLIEDSIKNN